MKKNIILSALMLLIALCIPFASATTIGKYVNAGATVFVGEDGLDITEATNNSDNIGWWESSYDITRTLPDKRLLITNRKQAFSVTPAEFTLALGNWYRLKNDGRPDGIAFNVIDPYLDLQIWNDDTDSSVYNNKVTSGTRIKFRIDSNLYEVNTKRYDTPSPSHTPISTSNGFVNIIVKSSNGASYSQLIGSPNSLKNIFINSPNQFWNGIWITNAVNENNIKAYPDGIYTIYAESNLNRIKDNYKQNGADYTGKTISVIRTLNIIQSSVSITSNNQRVIRGNPFIITIVGSPNTNYHIWAVKTNILSDKTPPTIQLYQEGVDIGAGGNYKSILGNTIKDDVPSTLSPNPYYALVKTDISGIRTVAFSTYTNTSSQKYTVRVESDDTANTKYDEVNIEVGSGGLTISANEDQTYYLGEKIRFNGINTETSTVYLFIYGPNLPLEGAQMSNNSDPRHYPVINNDVSTFKQINVNGDGSWSWDWSTSSLALDAGTYIIYAVSQPKSRTHLLDTTYTTTSIKFNKPTLTVTVPSIAAKGDPLTIKGYAEGSPSQGVAIWIMGTNYAKKITTSVYSDSSFNYELNGAVTQDMSAGQYFVIVQHPMQNGQFDIILNSDGSISNLQLSGNGTAGTRIFQFTGPGSLQGSDAANALIKAIEDPNIDDMYTKAYFTIGNPIITIDNIGDKYIGDQFTLTGQTNLNINTKLTIDIISSTFKPTNKSESGEFSGASIITPVITDNNSSGYNKYLAIIDTSTFKPDEYIVTVAAIGNDATATTLFIVRNGPRPLLEKTTILRTIPPTTVIPTTVVASNSTPAPIPTKSPLIPGLPGLPGFTSISAIIGILIIIIFYRNK
jgi:hypothetical protein